MCYSFYSFNGTSTGVEQQNQNQNGMNFQRYPTLHTDTQDRQTVLVGEAGSRLRRAALLTRTLTDGGRVFGAGSRPLLVKMVVQVPSCEESRADKLMGQPLQRQRAMCRVSTRVNKRQRRRTERDRERSRKEHSPFRNCFFSCFCVI